MNATYYIIIGVTKDVDFTKYYFGESKFLIFHTVIFLPSSFLMASIASVITSTFFLGMSPVSKNFKRSSTCSLSLVPKTLVAVSVKQSIRDAMEHLLAKNREILPLFLAAARPIKDEWKIKPYFGVFPFFLRARNRAFSAPKSIAKVKIAMKIMISRKMNLISLCENVRIISVT